jgi:hypothetical protein
MGRPDLRTVVAHLDLRDSPPGPDQQNRLDAAVADAIRADPAADPAVARFLVVDTASGLLAHQALYEQILAEPGYRSTVLCLVLDDPDVGRGDVGRGPEPAPGRPGFTCPATLRPPLAGVLWIGDIAGLRWRQPNQQRATTEADAYALESLVSLLRVPAVFDRMLTGLTDTGGAVATVALRVLRYDVSDEALSRAEGQALLRLAGQDADGNGARPGATAGMPPALAILTGAQRAAEQAPLSWLRPGGELDLARQSAVDAAREADEAVGYAGRPAAPLSFRSAGDEVPDAMSAAGAALRRYRELVAAALAAPDLAPGPTFNRHRTLDQLGIALPGLPELTPNRIGADLWAYTGQLLDERRSLREIESRLDTLALAAAPTGTAEAVDALNRSCPVALPVRLATAHPFRLGGRAVERITGTMLAGLLGGLAPAGYAVGLALVLLALAGAMRLVARRPDRNSPVESLLLPTQVAFGLLGASLGVGIRASVAVPPLVGAAAAVLGLVVAVAVLLRSWTAAVLDWLARTGIDQLEPAVAGIDEQLAAALGREWLLAGSRAWGSDRARALAVLFHRLAEAVDRVRTSTSDDHAHPPAYAAAYAGSGEYEPAGWNEREPSAARLSPVPAPAGAGRAEVSWLDQSTATGGPRLVEAVHGDLTDAVTALLEPYRDVLHRDPDHLYGEDVQGAVRHRVDELRRHFRQWGIVTPPPFSRSAGRRGEPDELLGVAAERLADVLGPDAGRSLVPLTNAAQRRCVAKGPDAVRDVRFAPAAVQRQGPGSYRPTVADPRDGYPGRGPESARYDLREDITWTESGRYAGTIRLLPLAPGTVREVRPREDEPDERRDGWRLG